MKIQAWETRVKYGGNGIGCLIPHTEQKNESKWSQWTKWHDSTKTVAENALLIGSSHNQMQGEEREWAICQMKIANLSRICPNRKPPQTILLCFPFAAKWKWMAIQCLIAAVLCLYCFKAATQWGNITGRMLQSHSLQQACLAGHVCRRLDALVKAASSQRAQRQAHT